MTFTIMMNGFYGFNFIFLQKLLESLCQKISAGNDLDILNIGLFPNTQEICYYLFDVPLLRAFVIIYTFVGL